MTRAILKIEGPAFREGMPLHLVTDSLAAIQGIVDKSYLVPQGRERISHEDRKYFYIRSYNIGRGSLTADIELIVNVTGSLLPIISAISTNVIWDYTKTTFSFLKLIFPAIKRGEQPRYEFVDNENMNVHIGDQHNHFHAPVYYIAKAAVTSYRRLTDKFGEETVHSVKMQDIEDKKDVALSLALEDKELFNILPEKDESISEVECEIYDFNKYENKGRLSVLPAQSVPAGKYPFSIYGDQSNVEYIQSMMRPRVRVQCIKEIKRDPFVGAVIYRLLIIKILNVG